MPQENQKIIHKIVVDTNIFVSSFFGGNPQKLFDLYFNNTHLIEIYTSEQILAEIENVLNRISPADKYTIADFLNIFRDSAILIDIPLDMNLEVSIKDEDDIKFIECAVTAGASYIISGDKHLLDLKEYNGIKMIKVKEFLDIISS